ncbi:MAG: hypothetical protein HY260_17430 [Chloroflexi bacterium]|nr:hypothetical protein [Chloroflexota bacterium]
MPRIRLLLLAVILVSCAPATPAITGTLFPTHSTPIPSPTPLGPPPTPICGGISPAPPNYNLDLALDYTGHTAEVSEAIRIVNSTGEAWPDLTLAVSANDATGVFDLHGLTVDDYPAEFVLEGVWLRIVLPAPLQPGCEIEIGANYALNLPRLGPSAFGWRGALGWTPRQTLLGLWYPTLAPYRPGVGWLAHPPAEQGEFETTDASAISLKMRLTGKKIDLAVVGSAAAKPCGESTCFDLKAARHFALALSDEMETATTTAGDATVTAMYFSEHSAAGKAALQTARYAFVVFTDRFGAVPYKSLSVVEADIVDGMEFSGMFFLGRPYYADFDGSAQNYLTLIAAHETAHQWWYCLVGNDPATEPWLDEALATYSEEIYFETAYPNLAQWWWQYRVWQFAPQGRVDGDIYASREFRPYVNAVYLNGAQFLHALRGELGDETFFDFLREYAASEAGRVATADDFWRAYSKFGDANGSAARRTFFVPTPTP